MKSLRKMPSTCEVPSASSMSQQSERISKIRKTTSFAFWNKTRIYILILTLACLTCIKMNALTFNFTVICMQDVVENYHTANNFTDIHWFERKTEKSFLFSGVAIGGLIGLIPAVPLISRFGLRNVQTISGVVSALGVLLFPAAVSIGFYSSLLCRILQGMGSVIAFTTLVVVPVVWAPNSEINTFMAILSCSLQLSNVICMPVSGLLCDSSLGWRSIYYLFGSFTFIIHVVFYLTYTDEPKLNRIISQKELGKISAGKGEKIREPVPYLAVCTDLTVLVTWVAFFGAGFAFFTLSLYGPTYLREILKFDVRETGFLAALPFILSAISKFSAGRISDKLTFVSDKAKFVFFTATSQLGFATGLVVMALTSNRLVAEIAFTLSFVFSAINIMGVIKCIQLRCRQHVHFAMAVIAFLAYAVQFLAPMLVRIICPDNYPGQWTTLFFLIAGVIIVCNAAFPFLTRSDAADYTKKKVIISEK